MGFGLRYDAFQILLCVDIWPPCYQDGELLRVEGSEKQPSPPPPQPKKERKPWGSDYDNYEDYYYEEDEVRKAKTG